MRNLAGNEQQPENKKYDSKSPACPQHRSLPRRTCFSPQSVHWGALHPGRLLTAALQTVDLRFVETKESHQKFGAGRWLGGETALFFQFAVETKLHVAGALLTPETLSRLFPARASVRSCSRPFSTLPRALENRRSARTHGACGNTRNTHPAFPARGNTICIRSLRRCLSPSAHGPDI